jgi:ribosome maturation factor RimP
MESGSRPTLIFCGYAGEYDYMTEERSVKSGGVVKTLEPVLAKTAEEQGTEFYDIEYVKENGGRVLRLYIDKPGGVDLNDCERVSRAAEAAIDAIDPIRESYVLEVSSPGIERKLRKDAHFQRYIGENVKIRLFKPVNGIKKYKGTLTGADTDVIKITDQNGEEHEFRRSDISACRLDVFGDE